MAITNLDSLLRRQEMNDRLRASANRLNPFFGQQQQSSYFSVPTGGFLGQNQIGGSSAVNTYRTPKPELTPEELEAQGFEDRVAQYQQDVGEFNLGQKEAELGRRRAEAEEIASGRNMLNGQAVTRAEMDQYQQGLERSSRNNPLYQDAQYMAARRAMESPPVRNKDIFGNFTESEKEYSDRLEEYLSLANKRAREQEFTRKLNQSRRNALINSINQFINDPMGYLLGGGQGTSTYSPDDLMSYLGQANQLFRATGQEGNFMDFIFGSSQARQGNVPTQSIQNRRENLAQQRQDLARREEEKRKSRSY